MVGCADSKPGTSVGMAAVMALSRLPGRTQEAALSHRAMPWDLRRWTRKA